MHKGLLFWVLMILWFFFGMWGWSGHPGYNQYGMRVGTVLLFVLFFLVGWQIFGFVIQ